MEKSKAGHQQGSPMTSLDEAISPTSGTWTESWVCTKNKLKRHIRHKYTRVPDTAHWGPRHTKERLVPGIFIDGSVSCRNVTNSTFSLMTSEFSSLILTRSYTTFLFHGFLLPVFEVEVRTAKSLLTMSQIFCFLKLVRYGRVTRPVWAKK